MSIIRDSIDPSFRANPVARAQTLDQLCANVNSALNAQNQQLTAILRQLQPTNSSGFLMLNNSYTAGGLPATGSCVILDSTGTPYNVLLNT